jgi:hypothetical protein
VEAEIAAMTDREKLDQLLDRVLDVATWDELLTPLGQSANRCHGLGDRGHRGAGSGPGVKGSNERRRYRQNPARELSLILGQAARKAEKPWEQP